VKRALARQEADLGPLAARLASLPSRLRGLVRRRGMPLDDATCSDIVQDALVRIWQKLETFRGEATLQGWAWRFVELELKNHLRTRSRRDDRRVPMDSLPEPSSRGEDLPPPVDSEHVAKCLSRLPPEMRQVIQLKHVEGLRFSEVAERLGVSDGTVKTRYYRGLQRLRLLLSSEWEAAKDA
jgi:RNA polymerase sigma-70 factor (ECF subfamily)